jgi:hypothetical protein
MQLLFAFSFILWTATSSLAATCPRLREVINSCPKKPICYTGAYSGVYFPIDQVTKCKTCRCKTRALMSCRSRDALKNACDARCKYGVREWKKNMVGCEFCVCNLAPTTPVCTLRPTCPGPCPNGHVYSQPSAGCVVCKCREVTNSKGFVCPQPNCQCNPFKNERVFWYTSADGCRRCKCEEPKCPVPDCDCGPGGKILTYTKEGCKMCKCAPTWTIATPIGCKESNCNTCPYKIQRWVQDGCPRCKCTFPRACPKMNCNCNPRYSKVTSYEYRGCTRCRCISKTIRG